MSIQYIKEPVVVVFKSSNRSNATTKMKVVRNKNIDQVNEEKIAGIPDKAVVIELGIGEYFIDQWKRKYNL
jgi:hypothetical protein